MMVFNLILKAAGKYTTAAGFWKLLLGTVMMLAFGYMGDWSITVPLQKIVFNLIFKAAGKNTTAAGFWKLRLGTVMMLAFGYMGETGIMTAVGGFVIGMRGWFFRGCAERWDVRVGLWHRVCT